MRNIFLLPTDKPSRLYEFGGEYHLQIKSQENFRSQHIYITSDEEIKDRNCWVTNGVEIFKPSDLPEYSLEYANRYWEKIILTTDQDLIKDGVQAIDDEFLEWFIKNPSCEKVEVRKIGEEWIYNADVPKEEFKTLPDVNWQSEIINKVWDEEVEESFATQLFSDNSKIIPDYFQPKSHLENLLEQLDNLESTVDEFVENSNEEKLREAGEKWVFETNADKWSNNDDSAGDNYGSFIEGVKSDAAKEYWCEKFKAEWYNEEEVEELLNKRSFDLIHKRDTKTTNEWFDKYKKK